MSAILLSLWSKRGYILYTIYMAMGVSRIPGVTSVPEGMSGGFGL